MRQPRADVGQLRLQAVDFGRQRCHRLAVLVLCLAPRLLLRTQRGVVGLDELLHFRAQRRLCLFGRPQARLGRGHGLLLLCQLRLQRVGLLRVGFALCVELVLQRVHLGLCGAGGLALLPLVGLGRLHAAKRRGVFRLGGWDGDVGERERMREWRRKKKK